MPFTNIVLGAPNQLKLWPDFDPWASSYPSLVSGFFGLGLAQKHYHRRIMIYWKSTMLTYMGCFWVFMSSNIHPSLILYQDNVPSNPPMHTELSSSYPEHNVIAVIFKWGMGSTKPCVAPYCQQCYWVGPPALIIGLSHTQRLQGYGVCSELSSFVVRQGRERTSTTRWGQSRKWLLLEAGIFPHSGWMDGEMRIVMKKMYFFYLAPKIHWASQSKLTIIE